MIEERYCSYEVSNLLQEKGFNQECFAKYAKENCTERYYDDYRERMLSWTINPGELIIPSIGKDSYEVYGVTIPAPTHQMACDWLREVYKIFIEVSVSIDLNGKYHYSYSILNKECKYIRKGYTSFDWNYIDAVEAALKYVLENLI